MHFFNFTQKTVIGQDLAVYGHKYGKADVTLELQFPMRFPHAPPRLHVVRPRFEPNSGRLVRWRLGCGVRVAASPLTLGRQITTAGMVDCDVLREWDGACAPRRGICVCVCVRASADASREAQSASTLA